MRRPDSSQWRACREQNLVLWQSAVGAMLLAFAIGAYFILAPDRGVNNAFSSVAWKYGISIAPIRIWGVLFMAKAVAALYALVYAGWRVHARVVLVGGALYVFWAFVFATAAIEHHWTGTFGAILSIYIAFNHTRLHHAMTAEANR